MPIIDRITRVREDEASLTRCLPLRRSPSALTRMLKFLREELEELESLGDTSHDAELLRWWLPKRIWEEEGSLKAAESLRRQAPFLVLTDSFIEDHPRGVHLPAKKWAKKLQSICDSLLSQEPLTGAPSLSFALKEAEQGLDAWHAFHVPYSPEIAWWTEAPWKELHKALAPWKEKAKEESGAIPGEAIGEEALREILRLERIPYTPDELIGEAMRHEEWCTEQMILASKELGLSTWQEGLEAAKQDFVPPGEQAPMVRGMAEEAIQLVESMDLMTLPPLAKEAWKMTMLTMEQQRVSPFFLGGETIYVSHPTSEMDHTWKEMSMRGNSRALSRATVQHELIPGHHLQQFFTRRHFPHRRLFDTPFWVEGWTLHWEMLWWDLGFPRTPLERIGMLFWRRHRAARVMFSLRFHQGLMTTQGCVDHLVEKVGHERSTAEGEVRRSFNGQWHPLYQAAYLIGGLQVRRLHQECLQQGWTLREFHDRFLVQNMMPISCLRSILLGTDIKEDWRFLDG
jgi:hypothetical protein